MLQFKIWMQDPRKKLIAILLGLALVVGLGITVTQMALTYQKVESRTALIEKNAKKNNKFFSELYMKKNEVTNSKKGEITLTYDLYLKKPFIQTNDLNTELRNFVQTVLDKYNVTHNVVKAVGIRLYDRKIVWDKGLQPRAVAFYSIQQEIASKEIKKGNGASNKDGNITIEQADGTKDEINTYTNTTLPEQAWNYTISNNEKINYQQYDLTVLGFNQYDTTAITKPLTDQEFGFWLKLKLYEKIIGSNNIDSAVMMYMNYDLGGNVSYQDFITIAKDFEEFDNRESKLGDATDFYPNDVTLRQMLAVYRPQLLFYVLSNGQMIKSRTEAQKQLVETQPQVYSKVISDHNKEAAKSTDKYGAQDYYKGDPFVALIGPYKKKYPEFSRPEFSPILQENSAFFQKASSPNN